MFGQIFIGSVLISATIVVEIIFVQLAIAGMQKFAPKLAQRSNFIAGVSVLTSATLWLLAALSLAIWIWAAAFVAMGAFSDLEQALYFSMVSFTTLGFGDVTLSQEWRLLSGFIAANGLVLFGLNTAFLIEALRRVLGVDRDN